MTERRFFGTDGIRGCFGEEPITPETVLKLGWATGRVLGERGRGEANVLIGKDTRVSGYLLESALEAGLSAAGVNIILLGPMPTPGIAYLTRTTRARAGVVISASHNQFQDNGIKFFAPDGTKLADELETEIERMMDCPLATVAPARLGKAERFDDARGRYIEFCKSAFPHKLDLNGLKVVVDCANGAAYHIAPSVFDELGADVVAIADEPDGFNINLDCGSTHPARLQQTVLDRGADIGVALDGDGDRVILVDHRGELVNGDLILYILAKARAANGGLAGGVVGTLMSNLGLEQALRRATIPFLRAPVGDRYVLSMLLEQGWELGGEASGHIICLDRSTTGDGIIAALQVLQAMAEQQRPLAELRRGLHIYPQTMINVELDVNGGEAGSVDRDPRVQEAVRAAQAALADNGRIVLRASGTEPVVRVMVEGHDAEVVRRIGTDLAEVVRATAGQCSRAGSATA